MKLRPLGDKVLVKHHGLKRKSGGGIIIPETAKDNQVRCFQGTVLAVGPGSYAPHGKLIPMDMSVGDEIIFSKFHGAEVTKTHDEDLIVLRDSDISAKIVSGDK